MIVTFVVATFSYELYVYSTGHIKFDRNRTEVSFRFMSVVTNFQATIFSNLIHIARMMALYLYEVLVHFIVHRLNTLHTLKIAEICKFLFI